MILGNYTTDFRSELFKEVGEKIKLSPFSVEKDWWVTMVLRALFVSEFAEHFSFKGGTSLSKCFRLIDRFSEDVDIAVNREFLGFSASCQKLR